MPYVRRFNLDGQVFGRWTVLAYSHKAKREHVWRCKCSCGTIGFVPTGQLRAGKSTSCGCLREERRLESITKHGHTGANRPCSPTYFSWLAAKDRVTTYGERGKYHKALGVTMCDRWMFDFRCFLADMGVRPPGKTLDRIDPFGNYEPGNCRWATPKEQQTNRRDRVKK